MSRMCMREWNWLQRYLPLLHPLFLVCWDRTKFIIPADAYHSVMDRVGKVRCRIIPINRFVSKANIIPCLYKSECRFGFLHSALLGEPNWTFWKFHH